jgi:hypothetical protein
MTARSIELVSVQALGLRLDREAIVCTARVREDSHVLLAAMQTGEAQNTHGTRSVSGLGAGSSTQSLLQMSLQGSARCCIASPQVAHERCPSGRRLECSLIYSTSIKPRCGQSVFGLEEIVAGKQKEVMARYKGGCRQRNGYLLFEGLRRISHALAPRPFKHISFASNSSPGNTSYPCASGPVELQAEVGTQLAACFPPFAA